MANDFTNNNANGAGQQPYAGQQPNAAAQSGTGQSQNAGHQPYAGDQLGASQQQGSAWQQGSTQPLPNAGSQPGATQPYGQHRAAAASTGYTTERSEGSAQNQTAPFNPVGGSAQFANQQSGGSAANPQHGQSWQQGGAQPNPGTSKERKKMGQTAKTFLVALAGAAVPCVVALCLAFALFGVPDTSQTMIGSSASTNITASDTDETLANQVSDKVLPSVAAIDVYTEQGGWSFYGRQSSSELVESSLGSGVVLTEDGYVITNYHVVEGGSAYKVTVNGETYDATLVGSDQSSDIAVLKCDNASGLTPIEIADSDAIEVGDWVMTIGSPFGLEQSVATGIVSATSRSQIMSSNTDGSSTVYTNLIQTDAAINPGNSGGALVDANGKLIGINTLITSYSGNYSGVGFAIPSNYAVSLAEQIINGETPTHAQLGVMTTSVTSQNAQMYGLSTDSGAYVSSVNSGSGAEAAGIEVGDIITAFDDSEITSASDLTIAVRSKNPGDTVTITINRDGQTMDLEVTLGDDSASQSATTQQESASSSGSTLEDLFNQLYGGGSNRNQGDVA